MNNSNYDLIQDQDIKLPVRMPEEEHDKIIIDERKKRNGNNS